MSGREVVGDSVVVVLSSSGVVVVSAPSGVVVVDSWMSPTLDSGSPVSPFMGVSVP